METTEIESSSNHDPALASVLHRCVESISKEMATVLMRSSRSPIFNEVGDLVTVTADRSGRTLAQTEWDRVVHDHRQAAAGTGRPAVTRLQDRPAARTRS